MPLIHVRAGNRAATDFDTKKIAIESRTDKIVLWFANTRNARVTKVEPID